MLTTIELLLCGHVTSEEELIKTKHIHKYEEYGYIEYGRMAYDDW